MMSETMMSDRDWQPIDDYDGQSEVLLRAGERQVFGMWTSSDGWVQLLDGDEISLPDFEPTEWADVNDAEAAAFQQM